MQTRKSSAAEAVANVAVGYGLALAINMLIFSVLGFDAALSQHLGIVTIFTAVSLVRSYCMRRLFNRIARRAS